MLNLIPALAKAKLEFKKFFKTKVASFSTTKGGTCTYSYASLDEILDAIVPALSGNGLVIVHTKELVEGSLWLITHLFHVSGEVICNKFPLPKTENPQTLGSAITYGRRYNICELLDIAADEDNDALPASDKQPVSQPQSKPQSQPVSQPQSKPQPVTKPSNKNGDRILEIRQVLGIDKDSALELLKKQMNTDTTANLTAEQVNSFILSMAVVYGMKMGVKAEVVADIFSKHVPYYIGQGLTELDAIKEWMNYLRTNLSSLTSNSNLNNQRINQLCSFLRFNVEAVRQWLKFEKFVDSPAELSGAQMNELMQWIAVQWASDRGMQFNHAVNSFNKHVVGLINQGYEQVEAIKWWVGHVQEQALVVAKV